MGNLVTKTKKIGNSFVEQFKGWTLFEYILVVVIIGLTTVPFMIGADLANAWVLFSVAATVTNILCVVEVSKGKIWNYFWGVLGVLIYGIVALNAGYGGDFMLNIVYYLPMQFIGFYMWKKSVSNVNVEKTIDDTVEGRRFRIREWLITSIATLVGTIILSLSLWYFLNDAIVNMVTAITPNGWAETGVFGVGSNWGTPLTTLADGFTTTASIVAMILMAKRFTEQWVLWIAVDVVTIIMWIFIYAQVGEIWVVPIIVMWVGFLINACYGYYNWRKKLEVLK